MVARPLGKNIIIIPARMDSERLPGKPMMEVNGKPLIYHVYKRAKETKADHVIVATPDKEIGRFCQEFGLMWRPTSGYIKNGTQRCADVVQQMRETVQIDKVINWQCDEVSVNSKYVDLLLDSFDSLKRDVVTLYSPSFDPSQLHNPDIVKAVVSSNGTIRWFSRAPMRGSDLHIGIYAFRADTLQVLGQLEPTRLCEKESLEQLTWLESGIEIGGLGVSTFPEAINSQVDFERFKEGKEG